MHVCCARMTSSSNALWTMERQRSGVSCKVAATLVVRPAWRCMHHLQIGCLHLSAWVVTQSSSHPSSKHFQCLKHLGRCLSSLLILLKVSPCMLQWMRGLSLVSPSNFVVQVTFTLLTLTAFMVHEQVSSVRLRLLLICQSRVCSQLVFEMQQQQAEPC